MVGSIWLKVAYKNRFVTPMCLSFDRCVTEIQSFENKSKN